eukprot:jgi/Mesen1/6073/ME000031S05337
MSSVCTRWRDVVRSSYQRPRCDRLLDVQVALSQLHNLRSVAHVWVIPALDRKHIGFLRGLATRFPLLTSFDLGFRGGEKDLEVLSLFLSLKRDIRELSLGLYMKEEENPADTATWECVSKALQSLDFSRQVDLKKLSLDYSCLEFPSTSHGRCCVPVSTSLAQLTGLQELKVAVENLPGVVFLPNWLSYLPAFVGFRMRNLDYPPSSSFLYSLGKMTSLKELVMTGHVFDASEMDVFSKLGRLTSLELDVIDSEAVPAEEPLCVSSTLQKLCCWAEVLPRVRRPLPLLEDLTLKNVSVHASKPTFFAHTPNIRSLHLTFEDEEGAWPHLERFTRLTSLSLDSCYFDGGEVVEDK